MRIREDDLEDHEDWEDEKDVLHKLIISLRRAYEAVVLIRADSSAELTNRPWFSRADISALDIHRYTRVRYHHVYIDSFCSHDRQSIKLLLWF